MKPLTFPCPKCSKRLGVGLELAGKSVRCPHCREVVVAPSAATATAPGQLAQTGQRESAESIFADPEESEDSLFPASAPRVLPLPPPDPHAAPATGPRVQNPLITPPPTSHRVADAPQPATDANPFAVVAPSPRRKPVGRKPIPWKAIALYALIGYAVLMTALAAWGWMRTL